MENLREKKQKLKNKIKILFALGFVQIWFWPLWFEYVVHSSSTACSSFLTMVAVLIYNVTELLITHERVSKIGDY